MRIVDADRLKKSFEANTPIAFQDCVPGIHAIIDLEPTVEAEPVRHGYWEETSVTDVEDCHIDQLQSARCSVCGRYHTAPYMYSWAHYDFCPHCGAKMERK